MIRWAQQPSLSLESGLSCSDAGCTRKGDFPFSLWKTNHNWCEQTLEIPLLPSAPFQVCTLEECEGTSAGCSPSQGSCYSLSIKRKNDIQTDLESLLLPVVKGSDGSYHMTKTSAIELLPQNGTISKLLDHLCLDSICVRQRMSFLLRSLSVKCPLPPKSI